MKNLFKIFLLSGFLFSGCTPNNAPEDSIYQLKETKGGRYYGGVFKLNESEYIKNLNPLSIIDVYSYRVASQVYEGLFKFNQVDITHVESALVESYMISDDQLKYTFHLKKGLYFHDDECFEEGKGREFTADDVIYCFKRLCTQDKNNQSFNLFSGIVKGADDFFAISKEKDISEIEIEGIKAIDSYTVEIELIKPSSIFLYNLARPGAFIYPEEAVEKYGDEMRIKCVGTGPFKINMIDQDISILLKRNDNYHETDEYGNKLPYLSAINIRFLEDKKIELLEFKKGNLDMMYRLPTDHIIEILDDAAANEDGTAPQFELQREAEMSSQFLAFNNFKGIFSDINVRKAFSFAIDREKILDYVLNGEGYDIGKYGFTPPSFRNYDIAQIKGYDFNLDSARYYLKKGGYGDGKGFPE
ncbi:MAG: ABC transporter substrate-binding protein, partial [Bacteroidota bacterium]